METKEKKPVILTEEQKETIREETIKKFYEYCDALFKLQDFLTLKDQNEIYKKIKSWEVSVLENL